MLSLQTAASMQHAATSHTDPELRRLLSFRICQLAETEGVDVSEIVNFLVVEAGDTSEQIETALGFSPLINFVDQSRYGDPGFAPSWEWIEDHGGWFELAYVLSDDGFGWIVFVPNVAGVDATLLALCGQCGRQT